MLASRSQIAVIAVLPRRKFAGFARINRSSHARIMRGLMKLHCLSGRSSLSTTVRTGLQMLPERDRLFSVVLEFRDKISKLEAELRGYRIREAAEAEEAETTERSGPCVEKWLTTREIQVLTLLSQGYTKQETGELLGLSENTVKTHIYRSAKRWKARNTIHLIAIAKDEGYI